MPEVTAWEVQGWSQQSPARAGDHPPPPAAADGSGHLWNISMVLCWALLDQRENSR